MPEVNPSCYHLSASSVGAFKACPTKFQLSYREGLRPDRDTDAQRQGTSWGQMHEVYGNVARDAFNNEELSLSVEDCKEAALNAVVAHLNERYNDVPAWITPYDYALERQVLLTSFIGYLWYYQNDPVEYLYSELPFNLPLHMPKTGLPLPMSEVQRVGKIDHLIRWQGMVGVMERKSTSRSIAPDSDYWDKSKKDTQVSMYAIGLRDLIKHNLLPDELLPIVTAAGVRYGNTLYDVWHKPTIKPKMLTQKDTAEFLTSGTYCDHQFDVQRGSENCKAADGTVTDIPTVMVDGELVEVEPGKKGFAIRETIGMFGARLLADIYERPEFYYVRREIARTDAELRHFRGQLFNIYQAQKMFATTGLWYENEQQCRATFACQYIPICYGPGAAAVCDGKTTPDGFKRIFVDLTVNGQEVEE